MRDHAADAKVFKGFCDENRLQILEMLRGSEKAENLLRILTASCSNAGEILLS